MDNKKQNSHVEGEGTTHTDKATHGVQGDPPASSNIQKLKPNVTEQLEKNGDRKQPQSGSAEVDQFDAKTEQPGQSRPETLVPQPGESSEKEAGKDIDKSKEAEKQAEKVSNFILLFHTALNSNGI